MQGRRREYDATPRSLPHTAFNIHAPLSIQNTRAGTYKIREVGARRSRGAGPSSTEPPARLGPSGFRPWP